MPAALVRRSAVCLSSVTPVLLKSDTDLKSNKKCNVELNAVPCSPSATVRTNKALTMWAGQHCQYCEQDRGCKTEISCFDSQQVFLLDRGTPTGYWAHRVYYSMRTEIRRPAFETENIQRSRTKKMDERHIIPLSVNLQGVCRESFTFTCG